MTTALLTAGVTAILLAATAGAEPVVRAPGQALNDRIPEARLSPIEVFLPEVARGPARELPSKAVVSVRVWVAVDRDGTVVDAEPDDALMRWQGPGPCDKRYPGADLSAEEARSFEESARAGMLVSRFAPVESGSGPFVRGTLAEGCDDPTIVTSLGWRGEQHGLFKPVHELTPDELDAARGIPPRSRRSADGDAGCGLLDDLAPDGVWSGPDMRPPILVRESKVPPSYPEELRVLRLGGSVTLFAVIDAEGAVSGIHPVRAAPGFPELLEEGVEAVCRWRYDPATRDGLPVTSGLTVSLDWTLR